MLVTSSSIKDLTLQNKLKISHHPILTESPTRNESKPAYYAYEPKSDTIRGLENNKNLRTNTQNYLTVVMKFRFFLVS